jgi:hypothetical protein
MGSLVPVPLGTLMRICVSCVDTGRSPVKRFPTKWDSWLFRNQFCAWTMAVKNKWKQTNSASDKKCALFANNKDSNVRRNLVPLNRVIGNQLVQKCNEPAKQLLLTKRLPICLILCLTGVFSSWCSLSFLHTRDAWLSDSDCDINR